MLTAAIAILAIGALTFLLNQPPALETGGVDIPMRLTIARQAENGDVDVVGFDGSAWDTLVPTGTIQGETVDGHYYTPTIQVVVPAADFSQVALQTAFCADDLTDMGHCFTRAQVYDVSQATLISASTEDISSVSPLTWLQDGRLLVYDELALQGAIFDPSSATTTLVNLPDFPHTLSWSQHGLSNSDSHLLYSALGQERILTFSTDVPAPTPLPTPVVTTIPGTPSAYDASWMAFAPSGSEMAIVRIRSTENNDLGAGVLQLFSRPSSVWSEPTVVAGPDDLMYSPAWLESGQRLAFLVADATDWRSHLLASDELTSTVQVIELSSLSKEAAVSEAAVRRQLIVPDADSVGAFLELDDNTFRTRLVDFTTDETAWVLAGDDTEHTAIGAPR
jgi:hypothetical protein